VLKDQTVLIDRTRITGIGSASAVPVPTDHVVVDGTGKFLIPGLWDMHVHFRGSKRGGKPLIRENEAMLPLFLANGVTGVREMGGDIVDSVIQWREDIKAGNRQGPRIATCGPKIDGPRPEWPGSIAVHTPQEARAAVQKVKTLGADFVKVYGGLTADSLRAVAEEARHQKLKLTGHTGDELTMLDISDLGMDVEHAFPTMARACTRDELALVRPPSGPKISPFSIEGARTIVQQFDERALRSLTLRFLKNGTALTPTLHTQWMVTAEAYRLDSRRSYLMPALLDTWSDRGGVPTILDPVRRKMRRIEERLVAQAKAAGVTVLPGSDTGAGNQNLYPGFSLHSELVEFVEAGMSPLQALQSATLDSARWLGRESEVGTVEKGKFADLVLLDANPLDDIRNTTKIRAVFANGNLLDRSRLDAMLRQAQTGATRQ
jgi:imidazolonepropionase-like amidohydrolase